MDNSWKIKLKPLSDIAKVPHNIVINKQQSGPTVYPSASERFSAFNMPFNNVKVAIIGQDPYHGRGQANGLAFSVNRGVTVPPSLVNIYKELQDDLGVNSPSHGDLKSWVNEGVLLLNTSLTVEAGKPASHKDIGWYPFVQGVVKMLDEEHENLVFVLWGKHAQEFDKIINNEKHLVIKSAHPSPYSADKGFFGSRPFSKCNKYLELKNKTPINWQVL
jgi:uracil-DNA glycosylase